MIQKQLIRPEDEGKSKEELLNALDYRKLDEILSMINRKNLEVMSFLKCKTGVNSEAVPEFNLEYKEDMLEQIERYMFDFDPTKEVLAIIGARKCTIVRFQYCDLKLENCAQRTVFLSLRELKTFLPTIRKATLKNWNRPENYSVNAWCWY